MFCICRQKLTQDYSHQVLSVLQQWETDVQKSEEQEEKLNVETFCQSCKSLNVILGHGITLRQIKYKD